MTLRDKFEQWFINDEDDEHYVGMVEAVAIEHEKIADEFAIEFAEWILINNFEMRDDNHENWWGKLNEEKDYSSKELLEIYKKEKGL